MASSEAQDQVHITLTKNDRLSVVIVLGLVAIALTLGLLYRQQTLNQTWQFESRTAGITARYPAGWLVDERESAVARIRDPKARPYKTQFVISVFPIGSQTSIRNVLDGLTLQRSTDLAAYRVLSIEDIKRGDTSATEMRSAFVDADPNPFSQRLPVVVLGLDIVIRDGNRAIVVSYMADEKVFETERPSFDRFVNSLRY